MGKLIDADAIPWDVDGVGFIPVIGKDEIDAMPEAVVRCKDCKYWNKEDAECPLFERTTLHDFYCWYGRREDGKVD